MFAARRTVSDGSMPPALKFVGKFDGSPASTIPASGAVDSIAKLGLTRPTVGKSSRFGMRTNVHELEVAVTVVVPASAGTSAEADATIASRPIAAPTTVRFIRPMRAAA
jgi:hypothetical protein